MKLNFILIPLSCFSLCVFGVEGESETVVNESRFTFHLSDQVVDELLPNLSTQKREFDFFGSDGKVPNKVEAEKEKEEGIDYQILVDQLKITMMRVNSKKREFVAGGQVFRVGGKLALSEGVKRHNFEVVDIDLDKVSLRSEQDGGVFTKNLAKRSTGISNKSGGNKFKPSGVIPLGGSNSLPIQIK